MGWETVSPGDRLGSGGQDKGGILCCERMVKAQPGPAHFPSTWMRPEPNVRRRERREAHAVADVAPFLKDTNEQKRSAGAAEP